MVPKEEMENPEFPGTPVRLDQLPKCLMILPIWAWVGTLLLSTRINLDHHHLDPRDPWDPEVLPVPSEPRAQLDIKEPLVSLAVWDHLAQSDLQVPQALLARMEMMVRLAVQAGMESEDCPVLREVVGSQEPLVFPASREAGASTEKMEGRERLVLLEQGESPVALALMVDPEQRAHGVRLARGAVQDPMALLEHVVTMDRADPRGPGDPTDPLAQLVSPVLQDPRVTQEDLELVGLMGPRAHVESLEPKALQELLGLPVWQDLMAVLEPKVLLVPMAWLVPQVPQEVLVAQELPDQLDLRAPGVPVESLA